MKKLILSMLFCVGVGVSMMATPAQVDGDDNAGNEQRIQKAVHVLNQAKAAVCQDRGNLKQELRKEYVLKQRAPRREVSGKQNGAPLGDLTRRPGFGAWEKVGKGPFPIPKGAHTNSLPGFPGNLRERLDPGSGSTSTY